jgi:MFS family permease
MRAQLDRFKSDDVVPPAAIDALLGEPAVGMLSADARTRLAAGLSDAAQRDALLATLGTKINAKENTQIWLAIGAIVGTIGAALIGDWIGRRSAYCLLCALSLLSTWFLYIVNTSYDNSFLFSAFLAGTFTASFYGWLPLYLPELFSTNVRATGQGFSFNFGRVLAAIGALQTGSLMGLFKTDVNVAGIVINSGHPAACSTISLIYVAGMLLIWLAPETKGKPLPD